MYTPGEVAVNYLDACETKTTLALPRMFLLGCLAGMFVALAVVASGAASAMIGNPSAARLVSGAVFPAGLAMVLIAGSELFTRKLERIMAKSFTTEPQENMEESEE